MKKIAEFKKNLIWNIAKTVARINSPTMFFFKRKANETIFNMFLKVFLQK